MKKKTINILKKAFILFLLTIALIISFSLNRDYTKIEIIIKDIVTYIPQKVLGIVDNSKVDQTESYLIQKNINLSLEKEIQELKQLLNLNSTLTEYSVVNATVTSRNNAYWFNSLTIDKGKKSGIDKNMAVITTSGLVGKVSKVSNNTSEIKLLTTDDITYKTSVIIRVNEKDYYGVLNGYQTNTNTLKVTGIDKSIQTKKGDIVETSGLGSMPKGIYIGTVEKEEVDNYNLSKIIYIKTAQDFNNINYVTILKEKK